ncbi:ABC transporter ATP-binding protein [Leifsonia sp. McL0607]|uniref:ABC transporter ATP-binding protein n=1 Tax=Leifsonia sp. McL0607 TaxID=3415672 RepID=UPI003CE88F8B
MRVDVREFRMQFGSRVIIEDLSFSVVAGETFGFLGSNGSGKTTTLRALLGMTQPTGGQLLIDGEPFRPGIGAAVGYLPEERGLYRKDTVLDVMIYFAQIKGIPRRQAREWSLSYLERVGLADKARLRLGKLSGGQQQKVQLGVAIMGDPGLLVLDEPAKGLDPVNRQLLMDLIAERKVAGATVILVTHNMDEVERLCDRALLLRDGRAAAYGTIREIQDAHGTRRIAARLLGELPISPLYTVADRDGDTVQLSPSEQVSDEDILAVLVDGGARPVSFQSSPVSLDQVFVRIYGEQQEVYA